MTKLLGHARRLPIINWNYTFFGAHLQNVGSNWDYPQERHAAFEMIYVVNGVEGIDCGAYSYTLDKGDFAIISPGTLHHVWAINNLTYFCFHFDLDEPTFEEHLIANSKIVYHRDESITRGVTDSMDKMINLLPPVSTETSSHADQDEELSEGWHLGVGPDEHYDFADKMKLQLLLSNVILSLYQGIKDTSHVTNLSTMQYAKMIRVYIKKTMQRQVDQVITNPENIEANLDNGNIIADICSQLNLSIGYASRLFKAYYGSSPKSYLSDIKKEIAQQLLLKPQFNINQIGTILGYKNPANFSRQFKTWTGLSPKQFRTRKVSHFVDQRLFSENFNTFPKENINDEEFKKNFWNSI